MKIVSKGGHELKYATMYHGRLSQVLFALSWENSVYCPLASRAFAFLSDGNPDNVNIVVTCKSNHIALD